MAYQEVYQKDEEKIIFVFFAEVVQKSAKPEDISLSQQI